jgi:hypothetical protein
MPMKRSKSSPSIADRFDREMLRSAFVSLFWNIISFKRDREGFTFSMLAAKIGVNKSEPTRWFSGERPNWTVNTISDIATALDVEIDIRARDRKTGAAFAAHGMITEPSARLVRDIDRPTSEPPDLAASRDSIRVRSGADIKMHALKSKITETVS